MKQRIPDRRAWGDLDADPEVKYAFKLFGGKSIEEAIPLFIDNPIERAAELRFVPVEVFNYYIFCFARFLTSAKAADFSDTASCFLRLVRDRFAREDVDFRMVYSELKVAIVQVSENQSFYGANEDIYGSFPEICAEIEQLARRARPDA